MRRLRCVVALGLSMMLVAGACGGDDDDGVGQSAAPPTAAESTESGESPAADQAAPEATPAEGETPAAPAAEPAAPAAPAPAAPSTPAPKSKAPAPKAAPKKAAGAPAPAAKPGEPAKAEAPKPGTATPAPAAGASSDAVAATPAPAGGNGGATDVGVTESEIKLGAISDNGAPLGNIVTIPVVTAVIGTFRGVNDGGGIHGRKVIVKDCDSAGDLTRFRACFKKLVGEEKIFAFITSITWGTGEVHGDLAKEKVPWFGSWGFFTSEWKDPWMFPAHMASVHEAHANSIYLRDTFKIKTVGILYLNIPEDKAAVTAMKEIFDPAGIKVVKETPLEIEDPGQDANVVAMRAADPDHVVHFAWSPPMVKWMLAAAQQGYWPPMGVSGNHFAADALGPLVGDWPLKGMWTITSYRVWSDNPEYIALMEKYAPEMRTKHHHITQTGYIGARIFIQTAQALGPNLTRQGMMDLWESKPWDGGPGIGVTFTWKPSNADRAAGRSTDNHDNSRCEYQFKYNKSDAGDYKVWIPAPEGYEICDTFD